MGKEDEGIECRGAYDLTCPFCGYVFDDCWEYKDDDIGLLGCPHCHKQFYASREIVVTYDTWAPTYGTCSVCGKEDVVVEDYSSTIGHLVSVGVDCCLDKEKERLMREYCEKGIYGGK